MLSARHLIAGISLGALLAAGAVALPSPGQRAPQDDSRRVAKRPVTLSARGGIGSFTPASADPRLAATLARGGIAASGFRFTPSDSKRVGNRAVTVAVRARTTRTAADAGRVASMAPTVSLAPIAYNLGVSVGWKRFALSGDVARVDLAGQPGSREAADLALSYTGRKASGRVKAAADRPLTGTPSLVADDPSYSVDVGGSYSLTRNLDVTAGVRYRSDRDRLSRIEDNRRDSQAVYVGTAFRF